MEIKAIETRALGRRFRSRTEARWGIYFDALGMSFDYEKEGYDLGRSLGWYLPDFWLPDVKMWAEVKPVRFSALEIKKCEALTEGTKHYCLMLEGLPDFRSYFATPFFTVPGIHIDYIIDETYLSDNRFFSSTGAVYPYPYRFDPLSRGSAGMSRAIEKALSARFEFGENQPMKIYRGRTRPSEPSAPSGPFGKIGAITQETSDEVKRQLKMLADVKAAEKE